MKKVYFLLIFTIIGWAAKAQAGQITFTTQLLCIDNNEACDIGDINGDGLLDVVAGRMWYAAPDFVPRPVRSIGIHPPEYARNNGEHLFDMNGDNRLDVVTTGWGETRILWYENPGKDGLTKGLLWNEHVLMDTKLLESEVGLLVDLNRDNHPEYIMNSWLAENQFSIYPFQKEAKGQKAQAKIIGPRNGHGVGTGDINGDGRTDILFDEGWYQQPESWEDEWVWHKDWELNDSSCPVQVLDLNEDGRNDIIYGRGHDYGLYWMEQGLPVGDSTTWTRHVIDESWSQVHAMSWADLDGDGKGELITGKRVWAHTGKDPGANDPAVLYRYVWNQKDQTFSRYVINTGEVSTGLFIRVSDLNQDQKQDIIVSGKKGTFILWQD